MSTLPPHCSAVWSAKHSSGSAGGTEEETAGKKKQAEIPCRAEGRRRLCCIPFFLEPAGAGPGALCKVRGGRGANQRQNRPRSSSVLKRFAAVALGFWGSLGWVCYRGEAPAAHLPPPPAPPAARYRAAETHHSGNSLWKKTPTKYHLAMAPACCRPILSQLRDKMVKWEKYVLGGVLFSFG